MDLFAGSDGSNSSSTKKLSSADQMKQKSSQKAQLVNDLDLLSGSSSSTPDPFTPRATPPAQPTPAASGTNDDDSFGIFTSAPPKQSNASTTPNFSSSTAPQADQRSQPASKPRKSVDDDFFGTEQTYNQRSSSNSSSSSSFDTRSDAQKRRERPDRPTQRQSQHSSSFKYDRELAQMLDMGFEAPDARRALEAMDGSTRGAVNWLMAEAQGLPSPTPRRSATGAIAQQLSNGDFSDLQAQASTLTASVFSKASSLFSKGRKELEKAYSQYSNGPGTPDAPAWMRDKAKYDSRRAQASGESGDYEMPMRRRENRRSERSESRTETPNSERRSESRPENRGEARPERTKPNRAELFRQRQKERLSRPSEEVMFESTERTSQLIDETDSAQSSRQPSRSASPPVKAEPAIDLLNIGGSSASSGTASATTLSTTSRDIYATSRELGSTSFRNGDYEKAVEHYTAALQMVPETHLLRAVLLSNRAAASMKAGNVRGAFDDTQAGLLLSPTRGKGSKTDEGTDMNDIWVKLVTRNAQAAEHMEKFKDALASWQLSLDNGHASPTVLAAKRRCMAALNPESVAKASSSGESSDAANGAKKSQRRGWGTTGAAPTSEAGKAASAKVKAQHNQQAEEERQRDLLRDKINARVESWKQGNEDNSRNLSATLQNVLWEGCDWTPVNAADLVVPRKVRIVYMKAVARTHPDKVSTTAPVEVKMISQSVFVISQTAWDSFRQSNNL